MKRAQAVIIGLLAAAYGAAAQSARPFPSYNNQEDYCRENPQMPTCIKGKPLDLGSLTGGSVIYKPSTGTSTPSAMPRRTASPAPQMDMTPRAQVALQDWRFSHASPALLVNINIGSLLRSPVWTKLLPASPADIEKALAALRDIGQLLISVAPNGGGSPSVLMLAKGNVDGALGGWLRSGSGMEAKRLDAITLLIGDAMSLKFADLRLRGPAGRETFNPLLQEATREALKYDAWIGFDPRHVSSLMAGFGAGSNPGLAGLASLRGLSFGIYLRDQVRLEASIDAPSPEIAERMLTAYKIAEAKQQPQPQGKDQVWAAVEGSKLRIIEIGDASQLDVPGMEPEMAAMIRPQITRLVQSLAGLSAAPYTTAAPRATSGAIVIQGLDGGPRQLPLK